MKYFLIAIVLALCNTTLIYSQTTCVGGSCYTSKNPNVSIYRSKLISPTYSYFYSRYNTFPYYQQSYTVKPIQYVPQQRVIYYGRKP
jgi:hypothetical protein